MKYSKAPKKNKTGEEETIRRNDGRYHVFMRGFFFVFNTKNDRNI